MREIGSFEAKTHLPALLKRVAEGESIVITRRGKPVAKLVPLEAQEKPMSLDEAIENLKKLGKGNRLNPKGRRGKKLTLRDLIEEGRRF